MSFDNTIKFGDLVYENHADSRGVFLGIVIEIIPLGYGTFWVEIFSKDGKTWIQSGKSLSKEQMNEP